MRVLLMLLLLPLAGCLSDTGVGESDQDTEDEVPVPFLDYTPVEPDMDLQLEMFDVFVPTRDVELHARIVKPAGDGPFPVIVQHTPYTAPGCSTGLPGGIEPPVGGCGQGTFDREFVRRGYAFAYADLAGTGDSTGCLDLRGETDIADIGAMADALAAMSWSNGNVGFIGASYPGSTSHMAALSGSPAVKAVIPVVASTSFYHYHHNSGVPYNGNHALGGTNSGYTQEGTAYTYNPISGAQKLADQPTCPHAENAVVHGGLDQSGDYYAWWQERNLRPMADTVTVPVLMAQGLADWNVKPDHVATYFNDIQSESKTFIGGQWGHAYPATDDGACRADDNRSYCSTPWGNWWSYAAAFFDTYLKEIDTGMFEGSNAWVQDNNRTWHRSQDWPLKEGGLTWSFEDGALAGGDSWYACPRDMHNRGTLLGGVEGATIQCTNTGLTQSFAVMEDLLVSGVPLVNLTIDTAGLNPHLVVVMDIERDGQVIGRENYGYLNPLLRNGLDDPEAIPSGWYQVSIDLYPQEDVLRQGDVIRLRLQSHDDGRSIEFFEETTVKLDAATSSLYLPTRPADLQGARL